MISLIQYDEFGKGMGFPSIKGSFNADKYEGQEEIIEYMKKGKITMVSVGRDIDIVTGETIPYEKVFMNDGEYRWTSTLRYYVEKYNLRLPKEFEEHVIKR